MEKDYPTILGIALAAIVTVVMTEGLFTLWDSMIGVICIIVMLTVSPTIPRHGLVAAGFAAVLGLCILLSTGFFFDVCLYEREWWVSARFRETVLILNETDSSFIREIVTQTTLPFGWRDAAFTLFWAVASGVSYLGNVILSPKE